jgi:ABC-2 type transport system ATP-binding protein
VGRRLIVRFVGVLAALALVAAGCADDVAWDDDGARSVGDERARADTTTTAVAGSDGGPSDGCDRGASVDEVESRPVAGVASDHTLTSFDGTEIRFHWFPTDATDEPAPTVLMGPGWSLPGDTSQEGAALFGALGIGPMNDAGYHVLTWDPRGFGASGGSAQVNDPEHEGRDVQLLLDWVAEQPQTMTDADGDPRVGMVGFSYGGGIQLTLAGIDCRVDALVPGLAWHSLETSLYRSGLVKTGWAGVLIDAAATGQVDPHTISAYESGVATGTLSDEDRDWFLARGPAELVEGIGVPTLLVHGTVDTLFTPDEAVTNHEILKGNGVPVAMLWFCGGHGTCRTEAGDEDRVGERTFAWLDHHLKGDESVDVGPGFETVDQDGRSWTAPSYPPAPGEPLAAEGSGTLALEAGGGSRIEDGQAGPGILDSLVWAITPGVASNAVEVGVDAPSEATTILGAPTLRLSYSGDVVDGDRPVRVFAQLVDDERGVVVGNQVTPIALQLDGEQHSAEVELETVVQHLEPGETLTLQLVATTSAYATPRLGGEVTFERIELSLPTAAGLERRRG